MIEGSQIIYCIVVWLGVGG